jgi:glycosyltransferase involved in cell wall biosynthesis
MQFNFGTILLGIWILMAVLQIGYCLYFFLRVGFHKDELDNLSLKPFSIIICAKNEIKNIENYIEQWCSQDYFDAYGNVNYEVLLVDDLSDDGSHYLYPELIARFPHFRVLQLKQEAKGIPGKKFPLSMGIKDAKFENLLLTDADCTPKSNLWLAHVSKTYNQNTEIVIGYGPYIKESGFLNLWQRWETLHTAIQYFGFALAKMPYMGVGRNLSYQRKIFNDNKGFSKFHHVASGDDDLFINQVANSKNTRVVMTEESFMFSKAKPNYDAWWFQKKRHLSTGKHYKSLHKYLLGLYSFSHSLFWVLLPLVFIFCKLKFGWILILCIFIIRTLFQWLSLGLAAKKLKENDFIFLIPLFDLITLFYNFKLLPAVFKNPNKWK